MKQSWKTEESSPLNQTNWKALQANEIPFIRIPRFATTEECEQLAYALEHAGYRTVSYANVQRFGLSYYEFRDAGKSAYFEAAQADKIRRQYVVQQAFDPLRRFVELARKHNQPLHCAMEPEGETYFAGAARKNTYPPWHTDSAPRKMPPDWCIACVTSQLSWNLYLQMPTAPRGGTLRVANRQWQSQDEQFLIPQQDGLYTDLVVQGAEQVEIQPHIGDVLLFNSMNYHCVVPSLESRLTMCAFLGDTPQGTWIYWS